MTTNPASLVRNRVPSFGKIPRNRGNLSVPLRIDAEDLCSRRQNGRASRTRTRTLAVRFPSPIQPSELPPQINPSREVCWAPSPRSLVRIPSTRSHKTPRNRALFSIGARPRTRSLERRRLNGGGGSPERTRLCPEIPAVQGEYREILSSQAPAVADSPGFPFYNGGLSNHSLPPRIGISIPSSGNESISAGNAGSDAQRATQAKRSKCHKTWAETFFSPFLRLYRCQRN